VTEEQLRRRANRIRQHIIGMLETAGSGHSGGALGLADLFAVLYFAVLRHRPEDPRWPDRDRLVLSAGHTCPVLYAALAESGYFPRRELLSLRAYGSRLQGHPHFGSLPGVETTSGPLGQGLSQAIGLAVAARADGKDWHTYAVLSDAEHQEGQTWEAVLLAGSRPVDNLTVIVDRNYIQISGNTEDTVALDSLKSKYEAFRWQVIEVDGHNISDLLTAFQVARSVIGRPVGVIARTVPGKGVPGMEGDYRWHGKVPTPAEADAALRALCALDYPPSFLLP
jgi:transketolase